MICAARRRVERAGRLVGEQEPRPVRERPRDRDPLALPARERARRTPSPMRDRAVLEQLHRPRLALGAAEPAAHHRQLHVLVRVQRRDQVVELEDEADRPGAVLRRILEPLEPLAPDDDRPRVRPVERPDQVQQRALAAAGRPGQRDDVARLEPERHVLSAGSARPRTTWRRARRRPRRRRAGCHDLAPPGTARVFLPLAVTITVSNLSVTPTPELDGRSESQKLPKKRSS